MANGKLVDFAVTNALDPSVHLVFTLGPSMTRQEFAAECDINTIMRQYEMALAQPAASVTPPMYVDFTSMPHDLMGAMQVMQDAEDAFMRLPASVRREFDNSAIAFVNYASDPANIEQMRAWELAPKKVPVAPVVAPVVPPVVPAVNPPPASPAA